MLAIRRAGYRGDGAGYCWPSGLSGSGQVGDVFGPRPFSYHVGTEGYNYDFHRGADVPVNEGDPLYAPINGAVCRAHYTHYSFQTADQLAQWTLVNTNNALAATFGAQQLTLTASRVGALSFPAGVPQYRHIRERINPRGGNDWLIEISLPSSLSVVGALGLGIINPAGTEYIALEYDGTTFTTRGVGTTTFTNHGATFSSSGQTWWRITYTASTDTYAWLRSTDGETWVTLASETGRTFTSALADYIPMLYWRSADTNATPYTLNVAQLNWYDRTQGIPRFGNWVTIVRGDRKVVVEHMQSLLVSQGDFVHVGQAIGRCGHTGFDATSGRVITPHAHIEHAPGNLSAYDTNATVNPLDSDYFPRVNTSNNVTVVRTRENDPDGLDSHRLAITVSRADQDFDLNAITLTGNLASRTINFNTRAGLNANNDIPKNNGVYLVPSPFNASSNAYMLSVYFNTAVVGTTFSSYLVADTQGRTLAAG